MGNSEYGNMEERRLDGEQRTKEIERFKLNKEWHTWVLVGLSILSGIIFLIGLKILSYLNLGSSLFGILCIVYIALTIIVINKISNKLTDLIVIARTKG